MHFTAKYDPQASAISEKITFFCDKYELRREDIADLKKRKLLNFVEEDTLPEVITCDTLIHLESFKKARIMLFNLAFLLPKECLEEPLLNKNLLQWSRKNGGFWIEFEISLTKNTGELILDWEL